MSLLFGDTAQNAIGFVSGGVLTTTTTLIDAGGAATYTPTETFNGGDEEVGSDDYTTPPNTLWGGRAIDADGTYTPTTTGTLLNNTTFSGPGNWVLSRNSAGGADDGKWELKYSGAVYYQTTNAVSGLPTTIPLDTDFVGTGEEATLTTTGFAGAQSTSNVQLARGRSTAKRSRTRASDIFVKIGANSRAWALEDVSVDVEDGGPVRSVS
jgi:hypothetical protein